ncbi:MAG: hypothetical protein AB8C95_03095 [Phycisphaeraceae bacterium]
MLLYIIPTIIAVAVLGFGAYYLARYMKGSLKLELSRDSASSEELFSGRVTVVAKKPINGLLKVSLVGREKRQKRSSSSDNNSTEWVEVYRYDHVLEETRDFEAGFEKEYAFDLLAPTTEEVRSGGRVLKAIADSAGDGMMGGVLKAAAAGASFMAGRVHWHIEGRLDAKGVDLYDKEKCQVNLKG